MEQIDLKKFMEYGRGKASTMINQPAALREKSRRLNKSVVTSFGSQNPLSEIPDEELYKKCQECGMNARLWLRKFAGLLPEVAKRGLHRKKGFRSLGEFAAKIAGMSEYTVDRILQLHAKIKDKPALLKLFESGTAGWSKIEVVAYVATTETDRWWVGKIGILSRPALLELVRNYRLKSPACGESQSKNLFGQGGEGKDFLGNGEGANRGQNSLYEPPVRFSFPASRDLEFDLRVAKQKMEKEAKQNLTWNETFQMIIKKSDLSKGEHGAKTSEKKEVCSKCLKKIAVLKICEECNGKLEVEASQLGLLSGSLMEKGGSHD